MKARVIVHLKAGVHDPQGEAVKGALGRLGYAGLVGVRVGKIIDLELDEEDADRALAIAREMAGKLLANPVIERFDVELIS